MRRIVSARAIALFAIASLFPEKAQSSAYGPDLPSHNYPTDTSFHLSYRLLTIRHSKDFVEPLLTEPLDEGAKLRVFRHEFSPEFQPNRKLSFGARLRMDSLKMTRNSGQTISATALSDNLFFTEFRIHDEPGSSIGIATLIKFPLYNNPTLSELLDSDDSSQTILYGDGQIDYTLLLTTENWIGTQWRLQGDLGFTYRSDGFASQLPYLVSVGFVTPKMDFALRLKGMFALGEGTPNNSDIDSLRDAFANSNWALSPNPWLFVLEPKVDLWLSSQWAIHLSYSQAMAGNNAPSYNSFGAGMVYRWSETRTRHKRTFKEVPIWVDQEAGKFKGESYDPESESLLIQEDPIFDDDAY